MKFLKDNLIGLIILVLLVIIFLDRCKKPTYLGDPVVKRDTVWIERDTVILSSPQLVKTEWSSDTTIINNNYIPDTNYAKLVAQYYEVVNQLIARNIFQDTIRIDTNGYIKIIDTVQNNEIVGRSSYINVKYPTITETITMPERKVNQLYLGGMLQTNFRNHQVGTSLLLKTKSDLILGGSFGVNTYGDAMYGVGAYWKLKFR